MTIRLTLGVNCARRGAQVLNRIQEMATATGRSKDGPASASGGYSVAYAWGHGSADGELRNDAHHLINDGTIGRITSLADKRGYAVAAKPVRCTSTVRAVFLPVG